METKLKIKLIGDYKISQGEPQECMKCKNAHWGTVIIRIDDDEKENYICIECLLRERFYYQLLSEHKFSDAEARAIAFEEPNKLLDGLDVNKLLKKEGFNTNGIKDK